MSKFNYCFANVGSNLASNTATGAKSYEYFVSKIDTIFDESELTWEECFFLESRKSASKSLKCSEVPDFDEFHINVISQFLTMSSFPYSISFEIALEKPYFQII